MCTILSKMYKISATKSALLSLDEENVTFRDVRILSPLSLTQDSGCLKNHSESAELGVQLRDVRVLQSC